MNTDSDINKVIPQIIDCKGTCKTPIGCTCRDLEEDEDTNNAASVGEIEMTEVFTPSGIPEILTLVEEIVVDQEPVVVEDGRQKKELKGVNKEPSSCCCKKEQCCRGKNKLEVYDWMANMPAMIDGTQMVEIQFKNTRKGYYLNSNDLELYKGDIVAVEATPGHDIGEVTMTGKLVQLQMKKCNFKGEIKRVYRIAKLTDLEKYEEAKKKEHKTMLRAREMAEELELGMKISDVEYQGDGNKAIFYYIADERVDFRQLIKVYASEFRVKIEMKQIGARQEAGRVGGIGPCGRELCCSSSMSNFISVSTSAARLQDIPLNPQKLAGQCGKLKCCLNFEVDTYVEAQGKLPPRDAVLETKDALYFNFKTDVLSGTMLYSTDKYYPANLVSLHKDRVWEVVKMNRRGDKPLYLQSEEEQEKDDQKNVSQDLLDQGSITRFDNKNRKSKGKKGANQSDKSNNRNDETREENGRPKLSKMSDNKPQPASELNDNKPKRVRDPNREQNNNKRPNNGQNVHAQKPNEGNAEGQNNNRPQNQQRRNNRNNRNRSKQNGNQDTPTSEA